MGIKVKMGGLFMSDKKEEILENNQQENKDTNREFLFWLIANRRRSVGVFTRFINC